jgi:transposase
MENRLSTEERIKAVKYFYKCSNYSNTAKQLNVELNKETIQPSTIQRLVKKFENTGSVCDLPKSGRPSVINDFNIQTAVLREVNATPTSSCRRIACQLDGSGDEISYRSVHRCLRSMGLKPYIPRLFHALHEDDSDRRLHFAEEFLAYAEENVSFVNSILWSDEAVFKLNGHINRHNCIYWRSNNPHEIIEKEVNLPGVTVWCGISSQGIIGPYFFDGTVSGSSYLEMLSEWLWPQIESRIQGGERIIFQHDGATPHFAIIVRDWLNAKFPASWIGRRGWMEWPPRSPDLTPSDFFLWGTLKDLVYNRKPQTIEELTAAITDGVQSIDNELCQRVCQSVSSRLQKCLNSDGHHFED